MSGRTRTSARARGLALIVAGIAAGSLLSGPAVAHVGKRLGHLQAHLDPLYLNEGQKASDSNLLDGLDSSQFLRSTGKAADAETLDGVNSTGFLLAGGKAVDADKLDNIDSAAFLQGTSTLSGIRSCPGVGFDPEDGAAVTTSVATGFRSSATAPLRCAIDLPHGATVSSVTFTVNDPVGGGNATCGLLRTDLTVPIASEDYVAGATASVDTSPGDVTFSATLVPANTVISNSGFGYSLECVTGTGTVLYGGVVTYAVPASAG